MKRKITLSIAFLASVVASVWVSSNSPVLAQNQLRVAGDTGVIKLGPNQTLRITVLDDSGGSERVAFRRLGYMPGACDDGVCKSSVSSLVQTSPIPIRQGEAVSFEVGPDVHGNDVRAVILSNSRYVRVNAIVFDTSTMRIVAIAHTTTTMYWP